MKIFIRNKLLSIGGSSTVKNENKEDIYKVKGKVVTFTKKKSIYDMEGNLLFVVKNKLINWFTHKAFIYDANKNKIATVKDKYLSLKNEFFVEGYTDEIRLEGGFMSLNSQFYKNDEVMATLNRNPDFFDFADAFCVDVEKEEDVPFMVALIIAIDNIRDNRSKSN